MNAIAVMLEESMTRHQTALAEIERLGEVMRQINARSKAMPGDDLKELQRQMMHIESLSRAKQPQGNDR